MMGFIVPFAQVITMAKVTRPSSLGCKSKANNIDAITKSAQRIE